MYICLTEKRKSKAGAYRGQFAWLMTVFGTFFFFFLLFRFLFQMTFKIGTLPVATMLAKCHKKCCDAGS